jgi:site-specific DNA recombinase
MERAMENGKHELKKAFGYLRVSGEGQIEKDGFPRQRATIEAFAKKSGIKIVEWFQEEAVCGATESLERPAFSRMMEALLSNGTRVVIIEKLDRIARDLFVQEGVIRLFKSKGLELISACEPELCSGDMYRDAMRQMMGVFAELDRKAIVYKLRAARNRKKAATGRCEGRKPFGFRPGEEVAVARMKALKAAGGNWESISKTMNAEGFTTRSGGSWFPATVRRIVLSNAA